jgi:hypothetical protein
MSEIPFSVYGFTTNKPPVLNTSWNEQKRTVDLSHKSYVFISSLYSSPWRYFTIGQSMVIKESKEV